MKQQLATQSILPQVLAPVMASLPGRPVSEKQAGELAIRPVNEIKLPARLTPAQSMELKECERILEKGLAVFFEVANALFLINNDRLYYLTHDTFEEYCHERWNMGRAHAYRIIGDWERIKLLPDGDILPKPTSEYQMRPFLKLEVDQFPKAWKKTVELANGRRITAKHIRAAIRKVHPKSAETKKKNRKWKIPVGQILVHLVETKKQIARGKDEEALVLLDRIESLLFERGKQPGIGK